MRSLIPDKAKHHKLIVLSILSLCLFFGTLQCYLNYHIFITPDEFWVASSLYHKYRISIPYRDFIPYKTVLGYYALLFPVLISHDPVYTLINIKNLTTFYNTVFLFISSLWLTRHFPAKAVLTSLALLISSYFFLYAANDIRVDMLAYWVCLISFLFLLENKPALAGITLGVAFCISQKALWSLCSSNLALLVPLLMHKNKYQGLRSIATFNVCLFLVVALYISFWSSVSSLDTVIDSMFLQAATVYKMNTYLSERFFYLGFILREDVFYFSLWIFCPISLLVKSPHSSQSKRVFIYTYAISCIVLFAIYKQPFYYTCIATIPPLFLLYTDFFSWLSGLNHGKPSFFLKPRELFFIGSLNLLLFLWTSLLFVYLPYTHLLMCLFPLLLGVMILFAYQKRKTLQAIVYGLIYLFVIIFGVILPVQKILPFSYQTGYQHQHQTLRLLDTLLQDGSTYVAGIDLLFNKQQAIPNNTSVEQAVHYLLYRDTASGKAMLSSLDLSPEMTLQKLIQGIENARVKLFVHCPYMDRLPPLLNYLLSNYEHYWGNIYLYAPQIKPGKQAVMIKFAGNYRLESKNPVMLDGNSLAPMTTIHLTQDKHHSFSSSPYRLKWLPPNIPEPPKENASDNPKQLFMDCRIVYINHRPRCMY